MVTLTRENQHDDSLLPDLANNIIYPIIRSTSKKNTNKKSLNLGSKNGSLVGCFTYHDGNMVETSKPWLFHHAGPQRPPFPPPGQPQRSASPAGNRHKHHQGIKTIHVFGKTCASIAFILAIIFDGWRFGFAITLMYWLYLKKHGFNPPNDNCHQIHDKPMDFRQISFSKIGIHTVLAQLSYKENYPVPKTEKRYMLTA